MRNVYVQFLMEYSTHKVPLQSKVFLNHKTDQRKCFSCPNATYESNQLPPLHSKVHLLLTLYILSETTELHLYSTKSRLLFHEHKGRLPTVDYVFPHWVCLRFSL